jgi:hypothetical protein
MKFKNLLFEYNPKALLLLCAGFILISAVAVKAQDSELEKLVKEVSVDSQKGAIFSYSYLMKFSYDRHRMGGRKFSRLYEAIIPSRFSLNRSYSHPFILLQDSEKTITEDAVKNAREAIARDIIKAENEEEKPLTEKDKPKAEDGGYWTMAFTADSQNVMVDILKLVKNVRLSNLQRKQIEGNEIVVVEFAPNPAAIFEKSMSYLSKIEGQIWIDETAKRIIRIEGFAPGAFAKLKEKTDDERKLEAVFLFSQIKVAEGFWFPQSVWLNFSRHPEIYSSFEVEFTFSNYKKGSVDIQYQEDKQKDTGSTSEQQ